MPQVGLNWNEREVDVLRLDGDKRKIKALCLGLVAVHPTLTLDGGASQSEFSVSMLACGHYAAKVPSESEARKIAAILKTRCRLALEEPDPTKVIAKLPAWAVRWLNECRNQRRCVEVP